MSLWVFSGWTHMDSIGCTMLEDYMYYPTTHALHVHVAASQLCSLAAKFPWV